MKVEDIPHGNIEPDPENPNEMSGEMLEALKDDIRRRGFVQPVLVRPVEGGYRLIDGEHRWRVLGELGAETVPCVVEEAGETDARLRMLTMNRLRGKFVPVRLAHLLADIAARIEPEEIGKRLSMGKAELNDLLDMGGYEPPTPERPEPEDVTDLPDEPPETVEVRIVARTEQAEVIRDLLSGLDDSEQALRIVEACAQT
jgi:ParB/RepB/Spo0J family partition protein